MQAANLGSALSWTVLVASACASAEPETPRQVEALDRVDAVTTDEAGVYRVLRVVERVDGVEWVDDTGAVRRRLPADVWSYEDATGELTLVPPLPEERERVVVVGLLAMPWAWHLPADWRSGSVRVLLGERAGVPGEDFEVDAERHTLRLLRPELCVPETEHLIVFERETDFGPPGAVLAVSFGNHRDEEAIRRFLGLPAEAAATEAEEAPEPDHGRVIELNPSLEPGSVKVVVGDRRLVEGVGFTVDYERGDLTLLDAEFLAGGVQYFISAGDLALGNYRDLERLNELLED